MGTRFWAAYRRVLDEAAWQMTRFRHWVVNSLFAATVLFGSVAVWTVLLYDPRPPHTILSSDLLTPHVRVGEPIRIRAEIERTRACAAELRRFWLDGATREVLAREELPGGHAPVGRTIITSTVYPPEKLRRPGRYIYRAHIVNECGAKTHISIAPDQHFEVVP